MDKNTLSNYGWIVIAVLVLAVMIALATPFGSYIEQGVRSTTQGLFDTSEKALNVVGMSAGDGSFGSGDSKTETVVAGATFTDGTFLTWDELKLEENGTKYGYIHYLEYEYNETISLDTEVFESCSALVSIVIPEHITHLQGGVFNHCTSLTTVSIPNSIIHINTTFDYCTSLTKISYAGTIEQWNNIDKYSNWNYLCPEITITCTDGTITIPAWS